MSLKGKIKMRSKLRAKIEDIPLLGAYLHDSDFTPSDFHFDPGQNKFHIQIERIAYEEVERGKAFFIIPVVRYPKVSSRLVITGIEKMEIEWFDDAFNEPDDRHQLLELDTKDDKTIELFSEYMKIILSHGGRVELFLEDESDSGAKDAVTDFFGSVFEGLDEINKLRM